VSRTDFKVSAQKCGATGPKRQSHQEALRAYENASCFRFAFDADKIRRQYPQRRHRALILTHPDAGSRVAPDFTSLFVARGRSVFVSRQKM
jgi:hypothetical protein